MESLIGFQSLTFSARRVVAADFAKCPIDCSSALAWKKTKDPLQFESWKKKKMRKEIRVNLGEGNRSLPTDTYFLSLVVYSSLGLCRDARAVLGAVCHGEYFLTSFPLLRLTVT